MFLKTILLLTPNLKNNLPYSKAIKRIAMCKVFLLEEKRACWHSEIFPPKFLTRGSLFVPSGAVDATVAPAFPTSVFVLM